MSELYDILEEYGDSDKYPLHGPGHKRKYAANEFYKDLYKIDVTELPQFDDLNNADGPLLEAMNRAASIYESSQSFFLVNGETAGILASISAAVPKKGTILMQRCSNKSAYDAAILRDLDVRYLYSRMDEETGVIFPVAIQDIAEALAVDGDVDAVYITSPTKDGFYTDLRPIVDYLHEKKIPLIVDASYGAHFGMADFLPESPVHSGADVVVESLSRTLPAPVQTGLLHVTDGFIDVEKIKKFLGIFQSGTPSYPLMAGIDECIDFLDIAYNKWQEFYENRLDLNDKVKELKHIKVWDYFNYKNDNLRQRPEMGKMILTVNHKSMDSKELYRVLVEEYDLQPEAHMPEYVLITLTVMDSREDMERLIKALESIDKLLESKETHKELDQDFERRALGDLSFLFSADARASEPDKANYPQIPRLAMETRIAEATESEFRHMPINMCEGFVAADFVGLYPPGQPVIAPGEKITKEAISVINQYKSKGYEVKGVMGDQIPVL